MVSTQPSRQPRTSSCEIVCELFKLLRSQWLSRPEIQREACLSEGAVSRWCEELVANGMLITKAGERRQLGAVPTLYALAPEWGGQAA